MALTTHKPYYEMSAEEIVLDVDETYQKQIFSVDGVELLIHPQVYPSHKFRTTGFVLKNLKRHFKHKVVCDMGCGPGIVGLYALKNGAKKVVQSDINPFAAANAKENIKINNVSKAFIDVYSGDCFENIPKQEFDIIVFNIPYHSDEKRLTRPLERAFYDPLFKSTGRFLQQAKLYSAKDTRVFIAFSNKGDVKTLENLFTKMNYNWKLWKITNTDQSYDNRIYKLKLNKPVSSKE